MIKRHFDACLLTPRDVPASHEGFQVIGAFNPGAAATGNGDEVVLLVRVVEAPQEKRDGYVTYPVWDISTGTLHTEWARLDEVDFQDVRCFRQLSNNAWRLTFTSHLRVVRLANGHNVSSIDDVTLTPGNEYEEFGVEDPRITPIGDTFWITYVGVSRHGVCTMLASTQDFRTFERHGVIFAPENKDCVFFPEKIGDQYVCFHRPNPAYAFSPPEMWLARSPDLLHWGGIEQFLAGGGTWCSGKVGAGPPPIRTDRGWLHIYHGNQKETRKGEVGAYAAAALLLDPDDPIRIIGQTPEPILTADTSYEQSGFVDNVIFPTGIVQRDDRLLIYSGCADEATGVCELSLAEILRAIR